MTPPTSARPSRPSVAVIGGGVSGLTAAYLLDRTHHVTLFEADDRLGGHAHTHDVTASDGSRHAVDSGFIVHNNRTYPWLRKLFAELDVAVRPTEMSMSIRCEQCGLEYAGGRGVKGMLAQRSRVVDPQFLRLLTQVRRFHRRASHFLETAAEDDPTTYGQFLGREGFSTHFITHYAVPVVSCVWSSGQETALLYPARYLFRFLDHHGLLSVTGSLSWFTVQGGSRTYVDKISARLPAVRVRRPVRDITRHADGVEIRAGIDGPDDVHRFDRVVIATHADQALAMLADPSDAEVNTLKAFRYSQNETLLHSDASILPRANGARASWNYLMTSCTDLNDATVVTYWMNRLQGHESPQDYLVTLNARDRVDPGAIIAEMDYEHPIYTPEAVEAQGSLAGLATGERFSPGHTRLGLPRGRLPLRGRGSPSVRGGLVNRPMLPLPPALDELPGLPPLPALVDGTVSHTRKGPLRHDFRHRTYQWHVDLDGIPEQPWYLKGSASLDAKDHIGDPDRPIKANIQTYLAANGIDLGPRGRILMLANARVLGYVFNPLSVFWCFDSDGTLSYVLAEVHNTYGERHAYLLHPDTSGTAHPAKALYVSPFYDVSGDYALRFTLAPHRVAVTVTLRRGGQTSFSATFSGRPRPATHRSLAALVVRRPLMPQRVSALIRVHAIWLWLRRLPVVPRPQHSPQEGIR